jgi:GR25 family glycosyltransferase involved in LPS biosynthesis
MGNKQSNSKNENIAVIGRITGGLGNQLFVIAATYAYSKKYNKRFFLTKNTESKNVEYWNNILSNIKSENILIFDRQIKKTNLYEYNDVNFKEMPNINKHSVLKGYFQSEKYFKEYKDDILKLLSLPKVYEDFAKSSIGKFGTEIIVAIHIRRGDYLKYPDVYHMLSKNYYTDAKKILEEKLGFKPNYLYFTNDKKWVRENFTLENKDCIVNCDKDYKEFAIMQQCHHFIIANSTFSWWAAYLSKNLDKIVIAPSNWYNIITFKNWDDIYPEGWLVVKDYCEGRFKGSGNANTLNLDTESWRDDIIVDSSMKFKRHLNEDKGVLFINENINLIYEDKPIYILGKKFTENGINLETFIQNQKSYIESKINMNNQDKKYDTYVINLKSREDRKNIFLNNVKNYDVNVNFFEAVEHKKGFLGCSLSHLYLIQYAKNKNLPYIIVMEDDSKILVNNEKFIEYMEILTSNLDKWEIFNGSPTFGHKYNTNEITFNKSFDDKLIYTLWGQSTSFMIYNRNVYDKLLNYDFSKEIDLYISEKFIQIMTRHEPFSTQICSYSDIENKTSPKTYEEYFAKIYKLMDKINLKNANVDNIENKIFMGILSCSKYKKRRENQDLKNIPFKYKYFIGNPELENPVVENDIVYLPCKDDYESLTLKVYHMIKWIKENNPDTEYIFKTDDDIRFDFNKLLYYSRLVYINGYDYAGEFVKCKKHFSDYHFKEGGKNKVFVPDTKYCTGAGYFISKKSINILMEKLLKEYNIFEDQSVGYCLNKEKIYPIGIKIKNNTCYY